VEVGMALSIARDDFVFLHFIGAFRVNMIVVRHLRSIRSLVVQGP
jgi:hypothetical protein